MLVLLASHVGFAANRLPLKHFIPGASVLALAKDQQGFVYFGTESGVVRFDGNALAPMRQPGMPVTQVLALLATEVGDLWVASQGGSPLLCLKKGALTAVTVALPPLVRTASSLALRGDEVWVGTNLGLFRVDSKGKAHPEPLKVNSPVAINALLIANDGAVWVAHESGISLIAAGAVSEVTNVPHAAALVQDAEGHVWAGFVNRNFALLFTEQGAPFERIETLPVTAMFRDVDGTLWLALEQGLMRARGRALEQVELDANFDQRIEAFVVDPEGGLWLGTASTGAFRVDTHPLVKLVADGELDAHAFGFAVAQDSNANVWITTTVSLLARSGSLVDRFPYGPRTALPFDLRSITRSGLGGIWAASVEQGLFHITRGPDGPVVRQIEKSGTNVVFDDQKGNVFFALSRGGLQRSDGLSPSVSVALPVIPHITVIASDLSGGIWLGSRGHGVFRLFADGRVAKFDTRSGLSSDLVFSIAQLPNGVVCFGTDSGGLDCMDEQNVAHYGAAAGLVDAIVGTIILDKLGALWLGTTKGILRLNALPVVSQPTVRARRIGLEAGLRSVECAHGFGPAGQSLADGTLVFATTHGAAFIDPDRLAEEPAPPVFIDTIVVNGQERSLPRHGGRWPVGEGNVQINYAAPRFSGAERLSFSYRLLGQDADWVQADSRRLALYTNLSWGSYRFAVVAHDGDSSSTTHLDFSLQPPFYQRRWFLLCALCVLVGVPGLMLRWWIRQKRLRRSEILKERSRLARDLHDTVEQSVVAVRLQLDAAIGDLTAYPPPAGHAPGHVERAVQLLRQSSLQMRTAIFSLRTSDGRSRDLVMDLSNHAGKLLRGTDIAFQLEVAAPIPSLRPLEQQQIAAVVSEALTNAVKHARARAITVRVEPFEGGLRVSVQDDGVGFDVAQPLPSDHYGVIGMRERAQSIGATLLIKTNFPTPGTQVVIALARKNFVRRWLDKE